MAASTDSNPRVSQPGKYKSACDQCSASKIKCPGGGPPCRRCVTAGSASRCHYSLAARLGKPLGTRNKKTLQRLNQARAESLGDDRGSERGGSGRVSRNNNDQIRNFETVMTDSRHTRDADPPNEFQTHHTLSFQPLSPSLTDPSLSELSQFTSQEANHQLLGMTDFLDNDHDALYNNNNDNNKQPAGQKAYLELPALQTIQGADSGTMWSDDQNSNWNLWSPDLDHQSSLGPNDNGLPCSPLDEGSPVCFDSVVARLEAKAEATTTRHRSSPSQTSLPCQCLREYTNALAQLQTIEMHQHPVRTDTLLTCTNLVLSVTGAQLRCNQCVYDTRVIMQLVVIIQTIFNWTPAQYHDSVGLCPDMRMALGEHSLTREESNVVKIALISRALQRLRGILKVMVSRVEHMNLSQQRDESTTDQTGPDFQNLRQLIEGLIQTSNRLTRWPPSRKP